MPKGGLCEKVLAFLEKDAVLLVGRSEHPNEKEEIILYSPDKVKVIGDRIISFTEKSDSRAYRRELSQRTSGEFFSQAWAGYDLLLKEAGL